MPDLISKHEIRVLDEYRRTPAKWRTIKDVSDASGVNLRTARQHAANLTKRGVLDETPSVGGYLYRPAANPSGVAAEYLKRFEALKAATAESAFLGCENPHPIHTDGDDRE